MLTLHVIYTDILFIGLTPTPTGGCSGDDSGSDSAVSMGSQSVGSPDQVMVVS